MASLDDSEATEVNVATTNEEFARNTSDESVGNDSDVFFEQPDMNVMIQKWLDNLRIPPQDRSGIKQVLSSHNLPNQSQDMPSVLSTLHQMLQLHQSPQQAFRAGGTHLAVLAQTVVAYLHTALHQKELDSLVTRVSDQTTSWLVSLFQLGQVAYSAFYHNDQLDGPRKVVQIALHRSFEKYAEEGFTALYTSPPVIYVGATGPIEMMQSIAFQLGMPTSTIRQVPSNTVFGSPHAMDTSALEQLIIEDKAQGKMPLMIVASAGTAIAGHIDNLTRLRDLADQHKMWLHIQGNALSSLCLPDKMMELEVVKKADSLLLNPGLWFGILSAPFVTLYVKNVFPVPPPEELLDSQEGSASVSSEKGRKTRRLFISPKVMSALQPTGMDRLLPLVLWICLQFLGEQSLVDTIKYAKNLSRQLLTGFASVKGTRRVCVASHDTPVLLFKYIGGGTIQAPPSRTKEITGEHAEGQVTEKEEPEIITIPELPQQTADGFTQSIIKQIPHIAGKVGLTFVTLPKYGLCCKVDPTESFPEQCVSQEDIASFCTALAAAAKSIHSIALSRVVFRKGLEDHPRLRYLEFPASLIVGIAQYVPKTLENKTEITVDEVQKLNLLNKELGDKLAAKSEAFSVYQHGNFTCIALKNIPPACSVHELLKLLYEETEEMESFRQNFEDLSSLIVKGIEEVQQDLEKEKQKLAEEEGMLRSIPIVGSVLGWLSPVSTGPVGRAFSLQKGTVQVTTKVYDHHMQINDSTVGSGTEDNAENSQEL